MHQWMKCDVCMECGRMKRKYYSWDECMNLREVQSLRKLRHPNIGEALLGRPRPGVVISSVCQVQGAYDCGNKPVIAHSKTQGGDSRERHSAHGLRELGLQPVRADEGSQKVFPGRPDAEHFVPNPAGAQTPVLM